MIRSAKQRRFLEATETQRGYAGAGGGVRPSVSAPRAPSMAPSIAPLTVPGGAVQSGGYLATTKFGRPSMPGLRKVR